MSAPRDSSSPASDAAGESPAPGELQQPVAGGVDDASSAEGARNVQVQQPRTAKERVSKPDGGSAAPATLNVSSSSASPAPVSPRPRAPSSSAASPSPSGSGRKASSASLNNHGPGHLLSSLASQITPACHVVKAAEGSGDDGNVFVHVIDGTGQFSCTPVDLTYLVLHAQTNRASSYSVVGIMGCQSTGKSTLLNLLFGTRFQEMDSSLGRSQTTKGVWMDSGARKRDLVVMDLEGTDSGERGEDRTTFERQTSLYALAVAEVLLINMWEHDIGRYTASNYGILKTVFEVNLQLFDSTNRTVLLFVIRDHIEEETPLAQLESKLHREIDKIWGEIRKPEKFRNTTVAELFELRFVALPHMKLQKALFIERVTALREQFTNPSSAAYLFSSSEASGAKGRKSVPADGFGVYMEQCWRTIRENKELNLPTQKEMLATFRCDEIIHALYADSFIPALAELRERAQRELVSDEFANTAEPLLRALLDDYSDETKHYHAAIVASKKRELLRKMARELEEIFATQARKFVAKQALDVCKTELKAQLAASGAAVASVVAAAGSGGKRSSAAIAAASSHDAPHPAFAAAAAAATSAAMAFAAEELAKFQLPTLTQEDEEGAEQGGAEGASSDASAPAESSSSSSSAAGAGQDPLLSWTALSAKVADEVRAGVESQLALERAHQLKKLSFHLDKVFKSQLSQPLSAILKRANTRTMWAEVGKLYRKVRQSVVQSYVVDTLASSYACSEEELASLVAQSELQLSQLIRLIVEQHTGLISLHLRSKFDSLFRYDPEGRIRRWGARDNIRQVFARARDEALQLLDLFAIFRLEEFKDADSPANEAVRREEEEALANKNKPATVVGSARRSSVMTNSTSSAGAGSSARRSSVLVGQRSSSKLLGESVAEGSEGKEAQELRGSPSASGSDREDNDENDEDDAEQDEEKVGHQSTVDYSSVDAANILIDASARLEKESTFRFDIEGALREAEAMQAANEDKTRVPMWMIALVCFLGMDEILAVLRNPFLMVFLVLLAGGAYMAHQVGALWPMIHVAKATGLQLIAQATQALNPPATAGGVTAGGSASSSSASTPSTSARRASTLRGPAGTVAARRGSHLRNPSLTASRFDEDELDEQGAAGEEQLEMTELSSSPIDASEVQVQVPASASSAASSGPQRRSSVMAQKRGSMVKH